MSHQAKRYTRWERQFSLLTAIGRPSGVTRAQARADIPAYADYDSTAAFRRTFERDIAVLRQAGYPIAVEDDSYRIAEEAPIIAPLTALDVGLVRSLLTGLGRGGSLRSAAHTGMAKILATTASKQPAPRFVHAAVPSGDAVVPIARALQYRRRVGFAYRGTRRRDYVLEPARLFVQRGAFYASGQARGDDGEWGYRTFRVSRVVPGSLRVGQPATRPRDEAPDADVFTARKVILAVSPDATIPLLARGRPCQPPSGARVPDGWACLQLASLDRHRLYEILGSYAREVRLLGGEDLVAEWRRRLGHLAGLTRSGAASADPLAPKPSAGPAEAEPPSDPDREAS